MIKVDKNEKKKKKRGENPLRITDEKYAKHGENSF